MHYETPKHDIRQLNLSDTVPNQGANMPADAAALPASPHLSAINTDWPQPASLKSDHTATAVKPPDAATDLNSARAGEGGVGQLQAALGQLAADAPRAVPAPALPEVSRVVHSLRQSYGSLLQRMTTLEANLHGMDLQQQQEQPEGSILHQFEPQHAQRSHAAGPFDAPGCTPAIDNHEQLEAAPQHLPFSQTPPASQQQESWHSMRSVRPGAEQAGKSASAVKHLWGAVVGQQQEPTWHAAPAFDGKLAASLTGGSPGAAIPPRTGHLSGTEGRQQQVKVGQKVGSEWICSTHAFNES